LPEGASEDQQFIELQSFVVIHAIYLGHPTIEYFRLTLSGAGQEVIRNELLTHWKTV
jgi:hypothetical protein